MSSPEAVAGSLEGPPPLAGLLALGMTVGTVNGLHRVAMPLYAASLGAQSWQVGIVGGLGYTGILLLALPMGAWIERHGSRLLFIRGVFVAALLYLALPFMHSPAQAIGAAAVLGLLLPLRTIPVYTEFLAMLPRLSPARAGWNRAANTLGMFFLGPAISAAIMAALGFGPVFELAAGTLLVAQLVGQRVLAGPRHAGDAGHRSIAERVRGQFALLREHADVRRTMAIDFLAQMTVAYFTVFGLVLAVRRFGMPLQQAAGLVTLQGALFVAMLFAGGALVLHWKEDLRYLLAFVLLLGQTLLYGLGTGPTALWAGAALSGLGLGLQSLTSTTRFGAFMVRFGRGRIGGLTSLGAPAGGLIGAMGGGIVSQRIGTQGGFLLLAFGCAVVCVVQVLRLRRMPS